MGCMQGPTPSFTPMTAEKGIFPHKARPEVWKMGGNKTNFRQAKQTGRGRENQETGLHSRMSLYYERWTAIALRPRSGRRV